MTAELVLRLHVFVEGAWWPAAEAVASGRPIHNDGCTIGVRIDGVEHMVGHWSMGRLDLVARQVTVCRRRVAQGRTGLVRSGVLDRFPVPTLLFEPPAVDGAPALVSRVFVRDREAGWWFPLPGWGGDDPEQLFDWVGAHRAELLGDDPDEDDPRPVRAVPVDAATVATQLASLEAECAEALAVAILDDDDDDDEDDD